MTIKEIAAKLDGIGYRDEINEDLLGKALDSAIVIVFGASDDLMEFRGAFSDELGCYEGGTFYVNINGPINKPQCECDEAEELFELRRKTARPIKAVWCKENEDGHIVASWSYETEIPHETFNVYEDGEVYCIGIVFNRNDI